MADQRTVPNNQMKTTPSKRGLARSSVSLLPVPKKIAAVARPIKSGYSERMKPINLFLLGTKGLAGGGADIGSRLSRTATRRNRQVGARAVLVFKAHPRGGAVLAGNMNQADRFRPAAIFFTDDTTSSDLLSD